MTDLASLPAFLDRLASAAAEAIMPHFRAAASVEDKGTTRFDPVTIADRASELQARTALLLMPARFQLDDADHGRLKQAVRQAGGELVRDAASTRFRTTLGGLGLPMMDVLEPLRAAPPGPDLFFQQTVHLTPRGHEVVAEALERFLLDHAFLTEQGLAGHSPSQ